MHWKRICLKYYCCECCNRGSRKKHKKINKDSLKRRARAAMKRFWQRDTDRERI